MLNWRELPSLSKAGARLEQLSGISAWHRLRWVILRQSTVATEKMMLSSLLESLPLLARFTLAMAVILVVTIAGVGAEVIHLEGIIGAFWPVSL